MILINDVVHAFNFVANPAGSQQRVSSPEAEGLVTELAADFRTHFKFCDQPGIIARRLLAILSRSYGTELTYFICTITLRRYSLRYRL